MSRRLRAMVLVGWWGAGAVAALVLALAAVHRPPAEPDALELLMNWPAAADASTPELF